MPLDIQIGGFAEKIRRSLGVRGRMPLRLDETVVPVVLVDSLDRQPFRPIEVNDFEGNFTQAAVAAEYPFIGINIHPAVAGAVVVDEISFWATAADTYVIHLGPTADYGATATAPVADFTNVEHPGSNTGVAGLLPPPMPFNAQHGTHPTLGIGTRIWSGRIPASETFCYRRRITVRPGWVLALWRATVNTTLECSIGGTYFPGAPPT